MLSSKIKEICNIRWYQAKNYFIVVKLKASVVTPAQLAEASIWVNPVPGSTEPTATAINAAGSSPFTSFALLILRQAGSLATSTTTGNLELDEIRYGSTWASVTPVNTVSCVSYDISNVSKCSSYSFNNQIYTTSGTYMITLPNANAAGCDSTITLNLTMSFTGINDLSASKLSVYPNPTNGDFTITGLELVGTVSSLSLTDMNGKVVKVLDTKATKFSMASIKPGVYFLNIISGNKQEVLKIVKE